MSFLSLIFGKGPQNAQIDVLQLDASVNETHKRSAKISENEIEDGSNIQDHITLAPDSLTIEGLVVEIPLDIKNSLINVAGSFIGSQIGGGIAGVLVQAGIGALGSSLLNGDQDRPLNALLQLDQLFEERVPFNVVTKLKTYENMVIQSIVIPKNKQMGRSLRFTVELKRLKIVRSKTILVPESVVKGINSHSASSEANTGKQKANEASDAQKKGSSLAFKGLEAIF